MREYWKVWRRGRDSNSRSTKWTPVFKTGGFNRSPTPPYVKSSACGLLGGCFGVFATILVTICGAESIRNVVVLKVNVELMHLNRRMTASLHGYINIDAPPG